MENPSYHELVLLAIELDENMDTQSEEFQKLITYLAMNWSRSYFILRKMLPFDKSLIERCRQRFIYKVIKPGWLFKIICENKDKAPIYTQVDVALTILYVENRITRSKNGLYSV